MKENETGTTKASESNTTARLPWNAPTIAELPKLTELTLLTGAGIPGGGGTGGGGSTVF